MVTASVGHAIAQANISSGGAHLGFVVNREESRHYFPHSFSGFLSINIFYHQFAIFIHLYSVAGTVDNTAVLSTRTVLPPNPAPIEDYNSFAMAICDTRGRIIKRLMFFSTL
jgi:hypothetical protein